MFDTSYYHAGNHTNNIKINAVTGAILKNHPKSWFERFNLKSDRAKALLTEGGHKAFDRKYEDTPLYSNHWRNVENPDKDITVLQMVICGDMEVMAELVYTKDYEAQDEQ
ncbi:MAG: hypothetical protein IJ444_02270 [Kiritimatiellae bacterium]|nr:hypothetical protein [Kiritimatiellia bacterium]